VRNIVCDSSVAHKFWGVDHQYLLPEKNINCEAGVCEVNLEISGVWLDEQSG